MRGLLFSHPTGNANVRWALAGLLEAGLLGEFHTAIATYPGNMWDVLGKSNWGREFKRRTFDERLRQVTVQHPLRELGRMLSSRLRMPQLSRHETGAFCIDSVYHGQDQKAARRVRKFPNSYSGVYTYEDGALETLKSAKEMNLRRIYDLPIAYWRTLRRLLAEEAERLPDWKVTLGGGVTDSEAKLERKTRELGLAEVVICPSQFVADSIPKPERAGKKIVVAPFGSPQSSSFKNGDTAAAPANGKLRILFAGSMGQRKGLGDLFAAMNLLKRNDVELVVMGSPQAPMEFYRKQFGDFTYERNRSHDEVLELMRSCHVFCLPSIVEGRALVMQEAMSQGLPLIITSHTGGEDLIVEGSTGFLVPIRRADVIAEKIAWFADNRPKLAEMSRTAQAKAVDLTWEDYGRKIAGAVRQLVPS